jgi:F-type H+-transporting ATPase subunit delta
MASAEAKHETVFDAGTIQARLARVYAQALFAAALRESPEAASDVGDELSDFVRDVVLAESDVGEFLGSPAVGKKAKAAALAPALEGQTSDLLRGLIGVLARNNRLDLLRGIAGAYRHLLDERAGRVPVKVTAAVELSDAQRAAISASLKNILDQEPVLDVRVDPDLLGGLVVQVGDTVIDTSVRTRLQSLRTLMLDKGTSYGAND